MAAITLCTTERTLAEARNFISLAMNNRDLSQTKVALKLGLSRWQVRSALDPERPNLTQEFCDKFTKAFLPSTRIVLVKDAAPPKILTMPKIAPNPVPAPQPEPAALVKLPVLKLAVADGGNAKIIKAIDAFAELTDEEQTRLARLLEFRLSAVRNATPEDIKIVLTTLARVRGLLVALAE